jgi:spermidine/putrescine transport system permease protein
MKQFSIGWSLIRIYTFLVYVFLFAPIVVVMVLAFNPKQFGIFPMEGVSFRWFIKLAQNEAIIGAFKNSLVLGSLTAVLSTGIGILAALAFIRFDFPGKNTLNTVLLSPIMIPEVVLGVAFCPAADRTRCADPALCAVNRSGTLGGH